ncbi:MAG TPA: hypothetical protein VMV72_19835 [Verrucomicrobiae bacterium]|nr:hypothetical protein [Verrucomicrobiae bacterium]
MNPRAWEIVPQEEGNDQQQRSGHGQRPGETIPQAANELFIRSRDGFVFESGQNAALDVRTKRAAFGILTEAVGQRLRKL